MDNNTMGVLSQIEKDIIEIVLRLRGKNKHFTFKNLLKLCKSQINYPRDEIFFNLQKLYEKNILLEYRQIVKPEILENSNRNLIYQLIVENPGIHLSELVQKASIPFQTCCWHLTILKQFQMIKSVMFKNRYCFGNIEVSDENLKTNHILRNELNKNIIKEISQKQQVTFSSISKKLEIAPSTLHYHINELKNAGLITVSKNGTSQIIKINSKLQHQNI